MLGLRVLFVCLFVFVGGCGVGGVGGGGRGGPSIKVDDTIRNWVFGRLSPTAFGSACFLYI